MLNLDQYRVLTFDCYGTLIDWESGILTALKPVFSRHDFELSEREILEFYGKFESQAEQGSYQKYRLILENVVRRFGKHLGFEPTQAEIAALPNSIANWRPFSDTVEALERLSQKYRLAILSNIDDDLFAHSQKRLKVAFDWVITAEQVGAYKPSHENFEFAPRKIGLPKEQILHVAQSLFHDHVPAKALGFSTVWINRRSRKSGAGATPPAHAKPDLEFPDLQSFEKATRQAR